MKTLRLITAMIMVVGLTGVFPAIGAEQTKQKGKKEGVLTDTKKTKDQKKTLTPGTTSIQAPAANLQSLPLAIQKLYVKDGTVRVVIKKQGSTRLSDEDYAATKLKVEASTLKKPLEWTFPEVDPHKRFTRRVRWEQDFDTGLAVRERLRVTATLYRGLWKTAKQGTLFPKMAEVDLKTRMAAPEQKKGKSRTPKLLPAGPGDDTAQIPVDQPASADTSSSQPRPGFTDSGSSAPSTPRIQVIEPNGGEFWEECSLGTVRWNYYGPPSDRYWGIAIQEQDIGGDPVVVHEQFGIRSSESCVAVRDTTETYYECTKRITGACIPEGDYKIHIWDMYTWSIKDSSDDVFQIGARGETVTDNVRIRGFYFVDSSAWINNLRSVHVFIDAESGHNLDLVEIEFQGHTVFHIDPDDERYRRSKHLDLTPYVTESGTYTLKANARDRMGNTDSHTLHLKVDLDDPKLRVNLPRNDVFYTDSVSGVANVPCDVTGYDTMSGIYSFSFSLHSRSDDAYVPSRYDCPESSCQVTYPLHVGEYCLYVYILDYAFNETIEQIYFSVRSPFDRPAGSSVPDASTGLPDTMGEPEDTVPIPPTPPEER